MNKYFDINVYFDIYAPILEPIGYKCLERWQFSPWKEVHYSRPLLRLKASRKKFR